MAANYTITTAALMQDHPNLGLPRSDLKAAPALTSHFRKPKGVGL
jgi:hypothetical protein